MANNNTKKADKEQTELFELITKTLEDVDGVVQITTYLKSTVYTHKHRAMFVLRASGVHVQRGRNWDCIKYSGIRTGRYVDPSAKKATKRTPSMAAM